MEKKKPEAKPHETYMGLDVGKLSEVRMMQQALDKVLGAISRVKNPDVTDTYRWTTVITVGLDNIEAAVDRAAAISLLDQESDRLKSELTKMLHSMGLNFIL